jgi:hypothetical protein
MFTGNTLRIVEVSTEIAFFHVFSSSLLILIANERDH